MHRAVDRRLGDAGAGGSQGEAPGGVHCGQGTQLAQGDPTLHSRHRRQPLRAAGNADAMRDVGKRAFDPWHQQLRRFGRGHASGLAVKQGRVQLFLQPGDRLRERWLGQIHVRCRRTDAAVVVDGGQCMQMLEVQVQRCTHGSTITKFNGCFEKRS
ncbi:hypothetical protein D3C71_1111150 [compost metagenome]